MLNFIGGIKKVQILVRFLGVGRVFNFILTSLLSEVEDVVRQPLKALHCAPLRAKGSYRTSLQLASIEARAGFYRRRKLASIEARAGLL